MKIKAAHIDGFGKWHDQDFNFASNPQIIYGPNEAGKTTLMAFIVSILFGFADGRGKHRYLQYLPKKATTYGGSLLVEVAGRKYHIQRSKGKNGGKVTVTDQQGQQFGPEKLQELTGNVDRALYQALFSFGQADLQLITDLDRSTWQQHLQQIGAVGSNEWLKVVDHFHRQADQLYLPRGRKWPLNRDLKAYQQLQTQIDHAQAEYQHYQQLQVTVRTQHTRLQKLKTTIDQTQTQLTQLEQADRYWPVFEQWQAGQKAAMHAQLLSANQVFQAQQLQAQVKALSQQQESAETQLQQITLRLDGLKKELPLDLTEVTRLDQEITVLQSQTQLHADQQSRLQDIQVEMSAIKNRYPAGVPAPLNADEQEQVQTLIDQTEPQHLKWWQWSLLVSGLLVAFIGIGLGIASGVQGWQLGLTVGSLIVGGVSLLGTVGSGLFYYFRNRYHLVQTQAQITAFGKEHGLAGYPTDQWLGMQADLQHYRRLEEQSQTLQEQVQTYDQQVQKLNAKLPADLIAADLASQKEAVAHQIKDRQDLISQQKNLRKQVEQTTKNLTAAKRELQALYQLVTVTNEAEFNTYLKERTAAIAQAATVRTYEQQLPDKVKQSLAKYQDHDELTAQLQACREQLTKLTVQAQQTRESWQTAQLTSENLVSQEQLTDLVQKRANLEAQINAEVSQWLTYQLAGQWIKRVLALASADRYPLIMARATEYFRTLTGDRYRKIMLDQEGLKVLRSDKVEFVVDELSQGTAEQLDIAMRLGFVTVMSDQANLPIMIDDGFVNFDQARRQRIIKLLQQIASHQQVLYFTADERIKQLGLGILDLTTSEHE